jgi:hypothetical protein
MFIIAGKTIWVVIVSPFEKAFPKIPPALPFSKGGKLFGLIPINKREFPPLKKGEQGGFLGFQANFELTFQIP